MYGKIKEDLTRTLAEHLWRQRARMNGAGCLVPPAGVERDEGDHQRREDGERDPQRAATATGTRLHHRRTISLRSRGSFAAGVEEP